MQSTAACEGTRGPARAPNREARHPRQLRTSLSALKSGKESFKRFEIWAREPCFFCLIWQMPCFFFWKLFLENSLTSGNCLDFHAMPTNVNPVVQRSQPWCLSAAKRGCASGRQTRLRRRLRKWVCGIILGHFRWRVCATA